MNILLIEDDAKTAEFIARGFTQSGFSVTSVDNGTAGLEKLRSESFDIAVVDVMLPGLDGISVVRQARQDGCLTPVIFLSAKGSVEDKISGLQAGGDDYLSKPFSFTELLARIQAMLRRAQSLSQPTQLSVADLTIDLLTRKVTRAGKRIELQPQEYSLLEYLMKNTGKIVSRTMILEHVWEYNFDPQTNIVETRLCRLREKIDKEFERKLIRTVRGFGYVLE
ncbi:MAG: response regulator transcription factor [Lentisphaeria bacterium]|nr:response regulator transcription factor [Lentisphaeria bacterium]